MHWASQACYDSTAEHLPTRRHAGCHMPLRSYSGSLNKLLHALPNLVRLCFIIADSGRWT